MMDARSDLEQRVFVLELAISELETVLAEVLRRVPGCDVPAADDNWLAREVNARTQATYRVYVPPLHGVPAGPER